MLLFFNYKENYNKDNIKMLKSNYDCLPGRKLSIFGLYWARVLAELIKSDATVEQGSHPFPGPVQVLSVLFLLCLLY